MLKLNISGGRVLEQLKLPVSPDEFKRKVDEIRAAKSVWPFCSRSEKSVMTVACWQQNVRLIRSLI